MACACIHACTRACASSSLRYMHMPTYHAHAYAYISCTCMCLRVELGPVVPRNVPHRPRVPAQRPAEIDSSAVVYSSSSSSPPSDLPRYIMVERYKGSVAT